MAKALSVQKRREVPGAREVAQWVRARAALSEEIQCPLLTSAGTRHAHVCANTHIQAKHSHTRNNTINLENKPEKLPFSFCDATLQFIFHFSIFVLF